MLKFAFPTACFALGGWQLWRLRWKEDLIAKLEVSMKSDPVMIDDITDAPFHKRLLVEDGSVERETVLVGPRGGCSIPGVNYASMVVRPMRIKDARVLLNCGWLPDGQPLLESPIYPSRLIAMREEGEKSRFIPRSSVLDIERLSSQLQTEPILFRLLNEAEDGLIRTPPKVHLSNRHLEYTLTWFGIGIATTAMAFLKR